ncbi:MAG TPA: alkaline phosphatase family protein [Thermomicrobiaceae bacterium]|nr:alkaline phosphatase family protein [Thermomicrobiaceae bacterium]
MRIPRKLGATLRAAALGVLVLAGGVPAIAGADTTQGKTTTPIQHLVVIFGENVSFDHYFGTYPYATNPVGEPPFTAQPGTPSVNGLANGVTAGMPTGPLLTSNGNASNPVLLGSADAMTCDQNHDYAAEQLAADHGAEDQYARYTGADLTVAQCLAQENTYLTNPAPVPSGSAAGAAAAMAYYDGNTVTALWNYAQRFAMSDNAYTTTYGPSTPGALNVTSAQTYGAICGPSHATINDAPCAAPPGYNAGDVAASTITTSATGPTSVASQPAAGPGTDYSDADPYFDVCSYLSNAMGGDNHTPSQTIEMGGNNVGQELTTAGVTWGWFQGGFDAGYVPGHGTTPPTTAQICASTHQNIGGAAVTDYIPHHEPFQYYASTANPMHLPPTSVTMVGHSDQANHQYDLADFWAAADAGNLPAVSFLKAPAYQDGHAGYSDPLDEQTFLVNTINHLQSLPSWSSTAVVITWDDSDGWYDHVLAPIITGSQTSLDSLTNPGQCGSTALVPTTTTGAPEQGKCGLGTRLPFLVISPYAKRNYVDNTLIDQSSVVRFIEDNWSLPALGNGAADAAAGSIQSMFDWQRPWNQRLFLNPGSGEPANGPGRIQRKP